MRVFLIIAALAIAGLLIGLPLGVIFWEALSKGGRVYLAAIHDPETRAAFALTLRVTAIAVACNTVFGLCAAWTIARFSFPGRRLLLTLIELPFSVSPVIAGLMFVMLFGAHSFWYGWLERHGWDVVFATPGLVLATIFVTLPFVARELIPLMQEQGAQEEEAALMLGAGGLRTFLRITLPNVKWALLYGVLLSSARGMGEFGAVSVLSGHIAGRTVTLPLQVEMLYDSYQFTNAFAAATLLTLMAFLTLAAKYLMERGSKIPK
jgi:sulfate transport system permease protein